MRLASGAFEAGKAIPRRFTCEGEDVSPELDWSGAPDGTRSFALIVEDPDAPDPRAPKRIWVHWVVVDIPADAARLAEDAGSERLPGEARACTRSTCNSIWTRPRKRIWRRPCAGMCWRRPS